MILGSEVRAGMLLDIDGRLGVVLSSDKSGGAMRRSSMGIELRDVLTNARFPLRLKPAEKVEAVELDEKKYSFLYQNGSSLHFMDERTFEQIEVDEALVGDRVAYLTEGMRIVIYYYKDKISSVRLPQHLVCQVRETDLSKKASDGGTDKGATLSNGRRITVPHGVKAGDWVKIRMDDEYCSEKVPPPEPAPTATV